MWRAQHATTATFMASAKLALVTATAFVKSKDLLTLPPNANFGGHRDAGVSCAASTAFGGFNPAPALEPKTGGLFLGDADPERVAAAAYRFKAARIQTIRECSTLTVHEAMPGHYVQGEYANEVQPRSRRLLRNIFGNGPYVEGWAVYSQQLMAEQGYLGDTPGYRLTLQKQLLRVPRPTRFWMCALQTHGHDRSRGARPHDQETPTRKRKKRPPNCSAPSCRPANCRPIMPDTRGWLAVREHYQSKHASRVQPQGVP